MPKSNTHLQVVNSDAPQHKPQAKAKRTKDDGVPMAWIKRLHARCAAIWPDSWASRIPEPNTPEHNLALREWREALAPYSRDELDEALSECRDVLNEAPTIAQLITAADYVVFAGEEESTDVE